ncbi:MAG: hypothetical protein LIP05_06760 [Tannerellaceae bacterium]|nr:hypothetical protein [Tannerellaceae bacterium]MCC8197576.1 hypothetical protein [Tannerellaceae bacterium]
MKNLIVGALAGAALTYLGCELSKKKNIQKLKDYKDKLVDKIREKHANQELTYDNPDDSVDTFISIILSDDE